ncbi:fungal specific transcription factor domain-containing protein [Ophiostoma piceae UAMH 11346]|uniref:Fungal specific transcription factor domain-containing protein n=1 Tax=Ophiostoma piceae (strain UAMH 11346) TaxID=1262450 RepID=S3C9U3_OPHP1|nr:fungal specific transcription factor domain-containing protein [Ophiostoma piceae UAMH 11346]
MRLLQTPETKAHQCDGVRPCSTCYKKRVNCTYSTGNPNRPAGDASGSSPAKRRHSDMASDSGAALTAAATPLLSASMASSTRGAIAAAAAASTTKPSSRRLTTSNAGRGPKPRRLSRDKDAPSELERRFSPSSQPHHHHHHSLPRVSVLPATAVSNDQPLEDRTRTSTNSGQDEEDVLEHTTRLLKDQTGRMLYIGDSATLSYLHLLRRMIESISGPSDFTTDPSKGNIVENVVDLPPQIRPPSMLADRQTANVLVESFFTNTSGLVEIFDRHEFLSQMDACYKNPLSANSHFLCLLFLTFAIGLVMATPDPGTDEYAIVQRLNNQLFDQAELFFRSAKCLCDPLSGLEDADFWSIQALSLISIYMLAVSKRNAAFAYHGMAVRSAIALGLHRKEAMAHFKGFELNARRNIWKSLYVLDRFIAASLGRPSAINEDECTEAALEDAFVTHISPIMDHQYSHQHQGGNNATGSYGNSAFRATETHMLGVNATVRSCRIIGSILTNLYARRRVSIRATQNIVLQCRNWTKDLHECLRWHRRPSTTSSADTNMPKTPPRAESIAILHVNLVYCHSIILLTRPFFLFLVRADRPGSNRVMPALRSRTEMFSEVCVAASYHSITMIQDALVAKYLPRRNPFVMYFLFTAALLVMSNEFVALFHHPAYDMYAAQAISIMEYFSKADAQGKRLLWILRELQKAVNAQLRHGALPSSGTQVNVSPRPFHFEYPAYVIDGSHDPITLFFEREKLRSTLHSSSSKPRLVDAASRLASSNLGNSASSALSASHAQAVYGPSRSTETDHETHRSSLHLLSFILSTLLTFSTHPISMLTLSQRPGHAGGGSGAGGSLGTSMAFGGAYGGFAGVIGGSAPGNVSGYFSNIPESKSGDPDGSDSIGTDNDGFDLDVLWQWTDSAATLAGTEAVPMTTSSVPAIGTTSLVNAGGSTMEHGTYSAVPVSHVHSHTPGGGDVSAYLVGGERGSGPKAKTAGDIDSSLSKQQGPMPSSPLPPMYSPYHMNLSTVGSSMSTSHGGSLMAAPMNVPLYPTADFG